MNKQKHASTIAVMKEIISLGHLGYGDKVVLTIDDPGHITLALWPLLCYPCLLVISILLSYYLCILLTPLLTSLSHQELFWLSATISGIPFVFEPYLAAHYGDCVGLVLHYDPNDINLPYSDTTATPLYLNAEHLIESKNLEAVGAFKRRDMSRPVMVHPYTSLNDTSHFKNKSTAWIDGSGCVCAIMGCIPVPAGNHLYLLAIILENVSCCKFV